jgi:2-polyprenyl-3-methyl-5-hydroxy-6-metoxy-1,4-benzoquinol methylase
VASFTEAEIQVLIALIELEEPIKTPNNNFYTFFPKSLEEAATYFRRFREDWTEAYGSLEAKGSISRHKQDYILTETGKASAHHFRHRCPPIWYWYREYYLETAQSKAHALYCERLFGQNMCQHGFADVPQLEKLLELLDLTPDDRVLDLGCGNGMIAEYLSDRTGARFTGIDYIPEAISQAKERTRDKVDRLSFIDMDLDELAFTPDSFDATISIDTLYFVSSKEKIIHKLRQMIRPGGRLGIFFLSLPKNPDSRNHMRPEGTSLARVLAAAELPYSAIDLTRANYDHLTRKRQIVEDLKETFLAENNEFLYNNLRDESQEATQEFDPATWPSSRFLYRVEMYH